MRFQKIILAQARHGTKREQKFWRPQGILTVFFSCVKQKNCKKQKKTSPVLLGEASVLLGLYLTL
jgi:predicted transporter